MTSLKNCLVFILLRLCFHLPLPMITSFSPGLKLSGRRRSRDVSMLGLSILVVVLLVVDVVMVVRPSDYFEEFVEMVPDL